METVVIDIPPFDGKPALKMAGKRYTNRYSVDQGLTLLLAHGSGCHKEQWEPTLETLFEVQSSKGAYKIREAWAFDWQGHGDSAVLNESVLKDTAEGVSISEWARALVYFTTLDYVRGHRLIVIGHSAGATAFMYSTKLFATGKIPYLRIILVEPPLIDKEVFYKHIEDRERSLKFFSKAIAARRDEWASKEEAFNWFNCRLPWSAWDTRVVHLLAEHGLRFTDNNQVTIKCDKVRESASYTDLERTFEATEQIEKMCAEIPIHVIYGETNDLSPKYAQDSVIDREKGRYVASVVRIPKAGHMVVQQQPDALAACIGGILTNTGACSSRL